MKVPAEGPHFIFTEARTKLRECERSPFPGYPKASGRGPEIANSCVTRVPRAVLRGLLADITSAKLWSPEI